MASVTGGTSISTTGTLNSPRITSPMIAPSMAQWLAPGMREIDHAPRRRSGGNPRQIRLARSTAEPTIGSARRHPRQGLQRRQVGGDCVQRVAEHVVGAADPAANVFQQVHHPQIGHRIHPKHADGIGRKYANARLRPDVEPRRAVPPTPASVSL